MDKLDLLLQEYRAMDFESIIDFTKFNEFTITHHSTAIEGSTLTRIETSLLLDEGITPKGKPLIHSLMVTDHQKALVFALDQAKKNKPITIALIQQISARVMKSTGSIYNTALGQVDASKGEFRKVNVSAGGHYFINYDKVEPYTKDLVKKYNTELLKVKTDKEKLELSFAAQFDLVNIHPFYDGNGRTSRLLMNYLQTCFKLPLSIVHTEDKADYYAALQNTRAQGNMQPFFEFMFIQYDKQLSNEIKNFKESLKQKINPFEGKSLFF
jgi:Fic family protein